MVCEMTTIRMSEIVSLLFEQFHVHNIRYAVLRNYEGLPEDTGGHDIDLVIDRSSRAEVHTILAGLQKNYDIEWIRVGERQYIVSYYLVLSSTKELLQVDLFFGQEWHGRTIIPAKKMLESRRQNQYNDLYILRPAYEAADSLFSSLIRGGFYKRRYHEKIKRMLSDDEIEAKRLFQSLFTNEAVTLWNAIMSDDFHACEKMVPKLRTSVTKYSLKETPVQTIFQLTRFVYWELRNRILYSGLLIYVSTGKTQGKVLESIEPFVYKYFKNEGGIGEYILEEKDVMGNEKTYYRKVQKKLNKTYAIIITGTANSKMIEKADLIVDCTGTINKPKKKSQVLLSVIDGDCSSIEDALIQTIKNTDKSRYKGFIIGKES